LAVIGVGGDALAHLFVRPLHLRVVAVDVLAREAEQLIVVVPLEPVSARTIDDSHDSLLSGLYALTVVPRAPNCSALRRVSSKDDRA